MLGKTKPHSTEGQWALARDRRDRGRGDGRVSTQLPDEVLGVTQPVVQGPRRLLRNLLDPVVDHVATPVDLHLHHRGLAQARHQLGVDRVEGLQRCQREGDPLVADRPETQRLLTVVDGGHWHLHHRQRAVDDEILGRQKLEDVAPFRLAARLGDALQEGHRLLPHLEDVAHPLVRGRALRIAAPALRLHDQRESGPGRVDVLESEPGRAPPSGSAGPTFLSAWSKTPHHLSPRRSPPPAPAPGARPGSPALGSPRPCRWLGRCGPART